MDWNKVGKWCVDSLREMVGEPVAIRRFLEQHRVAVLDPTELEETTSIAMSSVRPWHAWGDNGVTRYSRAMSGWRDAGGGYESFSLELAEFNGFGTRNHPARTIAALKGNIRDHRVGDGHQ
ncbi:hypothetical protein ABZQ90_17375 [Pseudomonas aeruginosa]